MFGDALLWPNIAMRNVNRCERRAIFIHMPRSALRTEKGLWAIRAVYGTGKSYLWPWTKIRNALCRGEEWTGLMGGGGLFGFLEMGA